MTVNAFFKHACVLCRAQIAFFTAFAAVTGHLLAPRHSPASVALTALAVFILAAGASALNQCQERDIDARMQRTRRRPLPLHVINPSLALFVAFLLVCSGMALLFLSRGATPLLLGVLAVLWYNGVYTYLKRITAFAAVPGAVVGMVPPAIGWIMGNGLFMDPRLLVICLLFFLWQVPHFWLQLLHHGEEYDEAGLPSLSTVLGKAQIARITFAWICSSTVASLLLPLYGNLTSPLLYCPLLFTAFWTMIRSAKLVTARLTPAASLIAFRQLNLFIFVLMSLLSVEKISIHLP
jgi:protoheme IX farnesyltransferase